MSGPDFWMRPPKRLPPKPVDRADRTRKMTSADDFGSDLIRFLEGNDPDGDDAEIVSAVSSGRRKAKARRTGIAPENPPAGFHFCPDWDGMAICADDPEWEGCTCEEKQDE